MAHPLSGANPRTLVAALRQGGAPDAWLSMVSVAAASLFRTPFSGLEAALLSRKLPPAEDLPPPIFILGHWRSGTTHLYNTMSLGNFSYVSPVSVGLPWDEAGRSRIE